MSGREMGAEVNWPTPHGSDVEYVTVYLGFRLLNGLRRQGWETLAGGRSEWAAFDKVELSGA